MKNLLCAAIAAAMTLALTMTLGACKTTGLPTDAGTTAETAAAVEQGALVAERAYAAAAASSTSLAIAGVLPRDVVKRNDAKAYAGLLVSRSIHDISLPVAAALGVPMTATVSAELQDARAAADAAHAAAQAL